MVKVGSDLVKTGKHYPQKKHNNGKISKTSDIFGYFHLRKPESLHPITSLIDCLEQVLFIKALKIIDLIQFSKVFEKK